MHQNPSIYDPSVISHFGWGCPQQGDKALPLLVASLLRAILGFWVHPPPCLPSASSKAACPQLLRSLSL